MKFWIRSMSCSAGTFKNAGKTTFVKGLNVIIGARGVFKSTKVQLLNSVLGHDHARIAELLKPNGSITVALGGGSVTLEVETPEGRVTVEKSATRPPKWSRSVPVPIEIMSQGDAQDIGEQGMTKRELVDRAHSLRRDEIRKERDELASALETRGQKLRPVLKEIADNKALASAAPELAARLEAMQKDPSRPKKPKNLEEQQKAYLDRLALFARAKKLSELRSSHMESYRELVELGRDFEPVATELRKNGADEALGLAAQFDAVVRELARIAAWADEQTGLTASLESVRAAFEAQSQSYHMLVAADAERKKHLDKENELAAEIKRAELAQTKLKSLERDSATLRAQRAALRADVKRLDDELYALRVKRQRELDELTPLTVVRIEKGADLAAYGEALNRLLDGGSRKTRETVIASMSPTELIDAVEQGDVARITKVGVRPNDAAKFVDALAQNRRLYAELESVVLDDVVEIFFRDEGVLKPVEILSPGQRATAILPLVLHGNTDAILVLDQPEDGLDNRFLYKTLLPLLQDLMTRRQVILVTHNANLATQPADRIIVMSKASAYEAGPPLIGSFELTKNDAVKILEGGAIAFRNRDRLYDLPALEDLRDEDELPSSETAATKKV